MDFTVKNWEEIIEPLADEMYYATHWRITEGFENSIDLFISKFYDDAIKIAPDSSERFMRFVDSFGVESEIWIGDFPRFDLMLGDWANRISDDSVEDYLPLQIEKLSENHIRITVMTT